MLNNELEILVRKLEQIKRQICFHIATKQLCINLFLLCKRLKLEEQSVLRKISTFVNSEDINEISVLRFDLMLNRRR